MQHGDDGVRFLLGIDHADRLMEVRVEFLAEGLISFSPDFSKAATSCLSVVSSLPAFMLSTLGVSAAGLPPGCPDRQQFAGKAFDGKLRCLGDVLLGAAADVLGLGLGAQPGVVVLFRPSVRPGGSFLRGSVWTASWRSTVRFRAPASGCSRVSLSCVCMVGSPENCTLTWGRIVDFKRF